MKRVGYWRSPGEPSLPDARDHVDLGWHPTQRLPVVEHLKRGSAHEAYFGWSTCRICGKPNGNLDLTDGAYVWPEGLLHYVVEHHVRPPADFIEHVLGARS